MKSEQQVIAALEKYLQSIASTNGVEIEEFVKICASAPLQRDNQIALIYFSKSALVTSDFKKTPIIKIGKNELSLNNVSLFEASELDRFLNDLSTRKVTSPVLELKATVANNQTRVSEEPFYCNCTFEQALMSDVCMSSSGKMSR